MPSDVNSSIQTESHCFVDWVFWIHPYVVHLGGTPTLSLFMCRGHSSHTYLIPIRICCRMPACLEAQVPTFLRSSQDPFH